MVTIALANSVTFVAAAIAAWKLGATPQPVNPRLSRRELDAIVELADSSLIVGGEPALPRHRPCLPPGWRPDPHLDDSPLPDTVSARWKAPTSGGSTGRPKLIVSTDPGLVDPDAPTRYLLPRDAAVLVPGPLSHNAPFMVASLGLMRGNHVVLLPQFDPVETLRATELHHCQLVILVPTMMHRIHRLPDDVRRNFDLSSLEVVWHVASPCPRWLKLAWIDWLGAERIYELYAGTEAQAVTVIRGDEWLTRPGTVGRPVQGAIRVLHPDTFSPLPPGVVGEIFMMSTDGRPTYEYIGADARRTPDGWESLGDMGWMDHDGYLYLTDRRADMIISGGANIYPAEVEAAIDEHPAVLSSAVVGRPDDEWGQTVHAIVQTIRPLDLDELHEFLADRLVASKWPRSLESVDVNLRDDAGKLRRATLVSRNAERPM
jgi:bile acid-coenzyme A ligase